MEFFLGFVLGAMFGISAFIAWSFYQVRKLKDAKDKLLENLKSKLLEQDGKRQSIIDRLKRAQAITEQQLDIRAATDQPSKNALHSRYKNGLIGDIKKLEEEKISILQSILDDGFDPLINAVDENGNKQELPLSHFVSKAKTTVGEPEPDPSGPKKVGRFVVVKGGKDDGTTH